MISKETIFDTLFEENMKTDQKLLDLNQRILKLENEFKGKYGDEAFGNYCKISELMLEELLECADFSFRTGLDLRKYLKSWIFRKMIFCSIKDTKYYIWRQIILLRMIEDNPFEINLIKMKSVKKAGCVI